MFHTLSRAVSDDFDPYLDDAEACELGLCKDVINEELYMPIHRSRGWIRCQVNISDQHCFRMYLVGNKKRFLLSAKQFGDDNFLISAHEDFPVFDVRPKKGYIARVEQQSDQSYLVCLNQCHLCDQELGYFSCGRCKEEREVLARIIYSVKRLHANLSSKIDFRCLAVTIPTVSGDGTREIWCPRSFRRLNPSLSPSADICEALYLCSNSVGTKYINPLPEWNDEVEGLVLKFQGNRVMNASSRNFLLYDEKYKRAFSKSDRQYNSNSNNINAVEDKIDVKIINSKNEGFKDDNYDSTGKFGIDDSHNNNNNSSNNSNSSTNNQYNNIASPSSFNSRDNNNFNNKYSMSLSRSRSMDSDTALSPYERSTLAIKSLRSQSIDTSDVFISSRNSPATNKEPFNEDRNFVSSSPNRFSINNNNNNDDAINNNNNLFIQTSSSPVTMKMSSMDRLQEISSSMINGKISSPLTKAYISSPQYDKTPNASEYHSNDFENSQIKSPKTPLRSEKKKKTVIRDAADVAVMQFGKSTSTRFVLDFRYPLSPVQAFGIAISSLAKDEQSKRPVGTPKNSPRKTSSLISSFSGVIGSSSGELTPPSGISPRKNLFR
eukprot:gene7331-9994_t